MGVVKSNAYGHNIIEFSKEIERLGVDWLGVDSIVEGLSLRQAKAKLPILVLGYTLPSRFEEARAKKISLTISSVEGLEEALRIKKGTPLSIHIKVDSGMHRQGFQTEEMPLVLELLEKGKGKIVVEGIYTHFAEAKNPRFGSSTRGQIAIFRQWVDAFHEAGYKPIVHAGATGGALLYPDAHFDMVRVGIGLYGLWPSEDARQHLEKKYTLKPVLSWHAVIGEVKRVRAGEKVGYDFTESLRNDSRIAIIPVGYWHGFPRMLSSKGRVLIHGKYANVLGRVSMDMIVVDVTNIPEAKVGGTATLIGKSGKEEIPARELATLSGTTHYEIVTRLNPLMERIYE
jgi:alanine racemase